MIAPVVRVYSSLCNRFILKSLIYGYDNVGFETETVFLTGGGFHSPSCHIYDILDFQTVPT